MNTRAAIASLLISLAAHAAETASGVGTPAAAAGAPAIMQPLAASSGADADGTTARPMPKHAHDDESLMRLKETPPEPALGILALEALFEATAESDNETRALEAQQGQAPQPEQQGRSTEPVAPRAQSDKAKTPPQAR